MSHAQWNNTDRRHRQSTAFISRDRKFIQIINEGEALMHQQSRLQNRYTKVASQQNIIFCDRIEVEVHKDRCKVFDLIPSGRCNLSSNIGKMTTSQSLTTWNLREETILELLKSNKCLAIVDGSFFPEHPSFISAHWKFACDKKIIGAGGFVAKVQPHLQSAYAAEVCGGLGIATSVQHILESFHCVDKIDFSIGTDCQSAIHRFSSDQRVVSFDTALSYEIREFLRLKKIFKTPNYIQNCRSSR